MGKSAIRLAIRIKRKLHRPSVKKTKDAAIHRKLSHLTLWENAKVVLLYAPIPHEKEVDTWPIIERAMNNKKTVALPVTNKKDRSITLRVITSRDDTELCDFKFPEPKKGCKEIKPSDIDLVIIPGIAFDQKGNRIGFGHGYYDRLLKKITCPVIALAYEFQILHAIPRQEHDVPISMIVTEKNIYHPAEKTP